MQPAGEHVRTLPRDALEVLRAGHRRDEHRDAGVTLLVLLRRLRLEGGGDPDYTPQPAGSSMEPAVDVEPDAGPVRQHEDPEPHEAATDLLRMHRLVYAREIGLRMKPPATDDRAAIEAMRSAVLDVIGAPSELVRQPTTLPAASLMTSVHVTK